VTTTDDLSLKTQNWTTAAKAKAYEEVKRRTTGERRAWYCKFPGRDCDGEPHEGYPYRHARGKQWPPPGVDWDVWLIMAGRGWGKSRTGAEWIRSVTSRVGRIALIGRRGPDVRQTMVEGESGLEEVCRLAGISYDWQPSKKEFTFGNGAVAYGFSAEEPATLRGPQFGAAWLDEPAHMELIDDVWSNLEYGLRLPGLPGGAKAICTSTPLPIKWVKERLTEEGDGVAVTRGHTDENLGNLDDSYKRRVVDRRRNTRLGRQELAGEVLEDVEGALWTSTLIQVLDEDIEREDLDRIVVAIDPAGTSNRKSDQTGIVVVGKVGERYYVLEDLSDKYSPDAWSSTAIRAYVRWQADALVAEKNYGGDMVKRVLEASLKERKLTARILVKTASRSKELRAEPVVALYEQPNTVFHNSGLAKLEDEMTSWVPGKGASPNRVDALVWAIDELSGGQSPMNFARPHGGPIIGSGRAASPLSSIRRATAAQEPPRSRLFLPPGFPIRRNLGQ
jgi:phage terminase large subunit-like protein